MMTTLTRLAVGSVLMAAAGGCSEISEVRWRTKFGPEYRSKGPDGVNSTRWTVQAGPQIKFENGWAAGLTYRHRWENEDQDDGVWFDFSFPIYRKSRADKLREEYRERDGMRRRLEALERRAGPEPPG